MGTGLTQEWATDDFLPSQILQAIGQSFVFTAIVVLEIRSMNPADVLTLGALFQTTRLFGGEIGTALMQTFVRVRERFTPIFIGLHVDSLGGQTADRLAAYRNAVGAHTSDVGVAASQAANLLGSAVAKLQSLDLEHPALWLTTRAQFLGAPDRPACPRAARHKPSAATGCRPSRSDR